MVLNRTMAKKKNKKGLGNPAAIAAAGELAPLAEKILDRRANFLEKNTKPILLTVGVIAGVYFGPKLYKKWRANRYANNNIGNPNLTAAAIIFSSFKRIKTSGLLSWIVPEINYWTNESALNDIASDPRINIKSVANAYKIMYDRNMFNDVQGGLSTNELNVWYSILNSQDGNQTSVLYPIGSDLFVAKPSIIVNIAEKVNGQWKGTGKLYKKASFNEEIGEVIDHGVFQGENYYIVKDCNFLGFDCETGVVLQSQVTDTEK